jgi:hypothetical protein
MGATSVSVDFLQEIAIPKRRPVVNNIGKMFFIFKAD